MVDSRSEAENTRDEPRTSYCQKHISYKFSLGRVLSKRFPLAKERKNGVPIGTIMAIDRNVLNIFKPMS